MLVEFEYYRRDSVEPVRVQTIEAMSAAKVYEDAKLALYKDRSADYLKARCDGRVLTVTRD